MRLLDVEDLPWLHQLFAKRYPSPRYDAATTERWFRAVVVKDSLNTYAARTDDAFLVAVTTVTPWLPGEPEVNVVCICAEENVVWQSMRLLRASIKWARARNAARWRLTSDTDSEIAPFAERLGAHEVHRRFEIDLRGA